MSTNVNIDQDQLRTALADSMHEHWVFYLVEGIVLVALGIVATVTPPIATLSVTIVIGWVFLASGIFSLATTLRTRHTPGFWWSLFSALLAIAAGLLLLASPGSAVVSLTLVLIFFFIFEGVASIMFGFEQRQRVPAWGWMVASGMLDLLLATILFMGFPGTAEWALGLLVGIDMVFGGAALASLALQARAHRSQVPTNPAR